MAHHFNLTTYTTFLTANGNRYSGVEAAKALAHSDDRPAHDTISRFLAEGAYEPEHLWNHVRDHVSLTDALIVDDTVLDKQRSTHSRTSTGAATNTKRFAVSRS